MSSSHPGRSNQAAVLGERFRAVATATTAPPTFFATATTGAPTLLITFGATGAGKSGLFRTAGALVGFDFTRYESALVDDLVENDPNYKLRIVDLLRRTSKQRLANPDPELYAQFKTAYFAERSKTRNAAGQTNDDVNDLKITHALAAKLDLQFETTGTYYPTWLINLTGGAYKIVLACTFVSYCNLIQRNLSRNKAAMELFQKNVLANPAPRLPDVNAVGDTMVKHGDVLARLLRNDWCRSGSSFCGQYPTTRVLLYTNEDRLDLVYDSKHATAKQTERLMEVLKKRFFEPSACASAGH